MLTPVKSIRKKCVECTGGSLKEVRECVIPDCPLFPYRMGKNPNRKPSKNPNIFEKSNSNPADLFQK